MFQLNTLKNFLTLVVLIGIISVVPGVSAEFAPAGYSVSIESELFTKCWEYKASPDLATAVTASDSTFYFLDVDRKLEAVDLASATKRWSTELGGEMISNILVGSGGVFVVTVTPPSGEATTPRKAFLRSLSQQTGITN